jgi:C4-dicarboxylate-specific signal transduction histidine kinase
VIEDRLKALRLKNLGRAGALVREQANSPGAGSDERGPKLARYLDELSVHLTDERDGMLKELASLQSHIDHIKAIVSKQQSYAVTFDVSQPCVASELADDAIALNQNLLDRLNIRVERRYEPVQELVTDRHKVLQILVNLVSNAKHALSKVERADRFIVVSVEHSQQLDGIAISVRDNGIGIRAEDHERLFNYGFTTRKTGHGFGLHMSSLAARELGGKLSAKSAGEAQGAAFVLDLPFEQRARGGLPRD